MEVLLTGPYGRCGTAIIDNLYDREEYDFTFLNRSDRPDDHEYGGYETVVADVADFDAIRPAFEGTDAVVHLAGHPYTDGTWEEVNHGNIQGMHNALEAAREAEIETFVFASSNHAMGMYEVENAPDIYYPDSDVMIDHTDPVRPDSYYGTSKAFGEDIGRQYVETHDYPEQFYAIRICSVRHAEYDHPYGDAESGADEGEWERGSAEYEEQVARMKAMWQSRRDFAHMIDCCLQDDEVTYGIFNGVSANDRRWYGIENARERLGYDPQDNGEEWDAPPQNQ